MKTFKYLSKNEVSNIVDTKLSSDATDKEIQNNLNPIEINCNPTLLLATQSNKFNIADEEEEEEEDEEDD